MKKLLLIALATCALASASQAAPVTSVTPVETVTATTTDLASRANTTGFMNEREFIMYRRAATSLTSAQADLDTALATVNAQRPVAAKKKGIRALRTNASKPKRIAKVEKPTPRLKKYFDADTLPGEDRD